MDLVEDGARGEVKLRPAERPRGEEDRELADSEAAADQRLEQGSAGAGDAHFYPSLLRSVRTTWNQTFGTA
jgi:hypothetical protein